MTEKLKFSFIDRFIFANFLSRLREADASANEGEEKEWNWSEMIKTWVKC